MFHQVDIKKQKSPVDNNHSVNPSSNEKSPFDMESSYDRPRLYTLDFLDIDG